MEYVFANENLVGDAYDLVFSILIEDDYIVKVGAVLYEFGLLQSCSDEPSLAVNVEFLVRIDNLCSDDSVETLDFGPSGKFFPYLSLRCLNHSMVTLTISLRSFSISAISAFIF